jgi:predicted nucleotidyltransferase component of viral defense system
MMKLREKTPREALKKAIRGELAPEALQHKVLSLIFEDHYLQEHLVLKGGSFLSTVYGSPRASKNDLDLSVTSAVDADRITEKVKKVAVQVTSDNPELSWRMINGHHLSFKKNGNELLAVQVQLNRPILRPVREVTLRFGSHSSAKVSTISINEQLAEKIDALDKRANEGKKLNDIHDIYFMIRKGAQFDVALIAAKLNISNSTEAKKAIEDILINNLADENMRRLWNSHTMTILNTPEFEVVADTILSAWLSTASRAA